MLVDPLDESTPIPSVPAASWIVFSLEIAIKYGTRYFVLVRQPYYQSTDAPASESGYLYPPFFGISHSFGMYPPQTVGEWKDGTDATLGSYDVDSKLDELGHVFGFGPLKSTFRRSAFEIKSSPTAGGHERLYRIESYTCRPRGELNLRNIADPLGTKGHTFIPLEDPDKSGELNPLAPSEVRGRRIISNFHSVLQNPTEVRHLQQSAIEIARDDLVLRRTGFLVLIDIASFGASHDYIKSEQGNVFETGASIGERFRNEIAELFEQVLLEANASESYFTGDGMLVGLPTMEDNDSRQTLIRFLEAYRQCVGYVHAIGLGLGSKDVTIGSRIMVHHGEYEFGRVGGPLSSSANFSGDSIVEVARAESSLAALSKSGEVSGESLVGLTDAAVEQIGGQLDTIGTLGELAPHEVRAKERVVRFVAGAFTNTASSDTHFPTQAS